MNGINPLFVLSCIFAIPVLVIGVYKIFIKESKYTERLTDNIYFICIVMEFMLFLIDKNM